MLRNRLLDTLFGLVRSRNQRRRQAAHARKSVRLSLEALETRINPSPITVQAATASQLQSDVTTANGNASQQYIIQLTGTSPYNLTTQLNLTNTAGVTIEASSATVINAATNSRIFNVSSGANLTLKDVTLQGGDVTATSTKGGAAIKDEGGSVTLSAVTVQNNVVQGSAAASTVQGGGIYVNGHGALSILGNSTITHNKALGLGGAVFGSASGGGIYASGSSTVTVTNSTVSNNLAQGGNQTAKGSSIVGGSAGAANGGGVFLSSSSLTITGSTLTGNTAQGGDADNSAPTTIVTTSGAAAAGGGALGGAVYASGTGWSVTITGSQISNNTAAGGTGAAAPQGANGSGTNAAGMAGDTGGEGGAAEGGAIYLSRNGTALKITSSALAGNEAKSGNGGQGGQGGAGTGSGAGGAGGSGGEGGNALGGAVFISSAGTPITVLNSSFTNDTAQGGTGGTGGTGGHGSTGGVGGAGGNASVASIAGGGMIVFGGNLTMLNTTVGQNTAQGGNAGTGGSGGAGSGAQAANGSSGSFGLSEGGGVYDAQAGTAAPTWINDTIAFNQALSGTTGKAPSGASEGGGLWTGAAAVLTNTMLESNSTTGSSGADISALSGAISSTSSNDFISNTNSLTTAAINALTGNNSILNNSTAQLGNLATTASGLSFYPLLANSAAVNAGANSALSAIATAEGVSTAQATDEVGNLRATSSDSVVDIGAIEADPAAGQVNITFTPPSITITPGTTSAGVSVTITDSSGNAINGSSAGGSVAFTLLNSSGSPVAGPVTANVSSSGQAAAVLSLPANLPVGSYTVQAKFTSSNGTYASATNTESLTVSSSSSPAPVTVTAGNGVATFSMATQTVSITVGVSSTTPVNVGSVVVTLSNDGTQVATGSGSVSAGQAVVSLSLPGRLPVGGYQLTEVYSDSSGQFASNSATGSLTINPGPSPGPHPSPSPAPSPPPGVPQSEFQAAMVIAIDVAELLVMGNSSALVQLTQLSEQFLQEPLTPPSMVVPEILNDLPYAATLIEPAVQLGLTFAEFAAFGSVGPLPTGSGGPSGLGIPSLIA